MGKRVVIGLGVLVLVILAGGGGYFYGVSVGQARANQARQQLARGRFGDQADLAPGLARTPQPGARAGGAIVGTIEAVEGEVVVLTTQQGSVRVKTTDTTLIEKLATVGVQELEKGERVTVTGSQNADGSVTARSIQSLRAGQMPQPNQP